MNNPFKSEQLLVIVLSNNVKEKEAKEIDNLDEKLQNLDSIKLFKKPKIQKDMLIGLPVNQT